MQIAEVMSPASMAENLALTRIRVGRMEGSAPRKPAVWLPKDSAPSLGAESAGEDADDPGFRGTAIRARQTDDSKCFCVDDG